jgi:formylglycine-generating enzyme required for sulfatase activity
LQARPISPARASDEGAGPAAVAVNPASPTTWPLQRLSSEEERALQPKDRFKECAACPEMVVIPKGQFMMGSLRGEGDRDEEGPNGKPLQVTISAPYALGRFLVTVEDYRHCVAEQSCPPPVWQEPGSPYNVVTGDDDHFRRLGDDLTKDRHPIVGVSWSNAQAYASWLNAKLALRSAHRYRLPSEAEWERAARGGIDGLKYFWGNDFSASAANASGESGGDKWMFTSPVGSFPANPYGLYDIHGNAWQWVEDCYHLNYAAMPETARNTGAAWTGSCDEVGRRVLRGGSWIDDPRVLRAADRGGSAPGMRYSYVGFRVARALAP